MVAKAEQERNVQAQAEYIRSLEKEQKRLEDVVSKGNLTAMGYKGNQDNERLDQQIMLIAEEKKRYVEMMMDKIRAESAARVESEKTIQQRIKEANSIEKLSDLQKAWTKNRDTATNNLDRGKYIADLVLIQKALDNMQSKKQNTEDKIKQTEDAMQKAAESGNVAELKRLAKVLDELKLKKKKLEEIVALENYRAKNPGDAANEDLILQRNNYMTPISTNQIYKVGDVVFDQKKILLYEVTAVDKTGPTFKKVKLEGEKLAAFAKKQNEEGAKAQEKLDKENEERKKDIQKQLIDGGYQLTNQLIDQLGLTQEQSIAMKGMVDIGANLLSGNFIGAGVSAISVLVGILGNSDRKSEERLQRFAELQKMQADYLNQMIELQLQYNLVLNDQILTQEGQNIFLTDYARQAKDASKALSDANQKYNALIKSIKIISGYEITDEFGSAWVHTVTNAENLTEALTALQVVTKPGPFGSLLENFPDLIDSSGQFNADLAKTLVNMKDLPDETKNALDGFIAWSDAAKKAREQIDSVITSLSGSMGNDLRDSLVKAFEDGTDSALAFGDTVGNVLENVMSNLLFNAAFGTLFDKLKEDMYASYGLQPDGKTQLDPNDKRIDNSWTDDIIKFYDDSAEGMQKFNEGLIAAKEYGKTHGFDLFNNPDSATKQNNSMIGAVKGVSEDTASLLAGQIMRIVDYQFKGFTQGTEMLTSINLTVGHLAEIAKNTRNNVKLNDIASGVAETNKILKEKL